MVRRFLGFAGLVFLAGCGGGSGGGGSSPAGPVPTPTPTPTPPPVVASSAQSVTAASGGSVTTTLLGETVKVNVPAGALSANSSVTLTVYATAGLPRAFASAKRSTKSLPTGATFITALSVDTGTATLTKPLQISATATTPASGSVVRLAGSIAGAFSDVDTATVTNGTATNDLNPAYAGPSKSGSTVLYGFYSVPSTSAAAAPAIVLSGTGPASVNGGAQATYAATESDANGFPFFAPTLAFSLDNAALGTIDATLGALTGTTAGQFTGNVVISDTVHSGVTTKVPVTVLSARPGTVGDTLSYTGTISKVITNYSIATPVPLPSTAPSASPSPGASASAAPTPTPSPVVLTQSGTVTQSVNVAAAPTPGQLTIDSDEVDTFTLSTLETKTASTISYATSGGSTSVRQVKTTATDSNGSSYETDYTATSGLLAILPEVAGSFGPNDASRTYIETDPGISGTTATVNRVTSASGAYTDTQKNADGTSNVATANADFSGQYLIFSGFDKLVFSAPTTGTPPVIPFTFAQLASPNYTSYGSATSLTSADWIPSTATAPYAESDTVQLGATFDPSCAVPAKFGTTGALVLQTSTSIDPVFGTIDTQTTKSYDVVGVGTVCVVFADALQTYYDYSVQQGYVLSYSSKQTSPKSTIAYAETLSLASAVVAGQPTSTQSIRAGATGFSLPLTHAAVAVARERFAHAVRRDRYITLAGLTRSARLPGGVR